MNLYQLENVKLETESYKTFCYYSRFIIDLDIVINMNIEKNGNALHVYCRMRSQNMGLVIMAGQLLKDLYFL